MSGVHSLLICCYSVFKKQSPLVIFVSHWKTGTVLCLRVNQMSNPTCLTSNIFNSSKPAVEGGKLMYTRVIHQLCFSFSTSFSPSFSLQCDCVSWPPSSDVGFSWPCITPLGKAATQSATLHCLLLF